MPQYTPHGKMPRHLTANAYTLFSLSPYHGRRLMRQAPPLVSFTRMISADMFPTEIPESALLINLGTMKCAIGIVCASLSR